MILEAQNMVPPVRNYKLSEYHGASKNWAISINKLGEVYVANHLGLLHFDGERWKLNQLPNKTIIRSVLVSGDRVYTGSYEEFGFWKENSFGFLEYTSLSHLIPKDILKNEEFWQMESYGHGIIFRSFSTLYLFENDTIKSFNNGKLIMHLSIVDGEVLFSTRSDGFFWFKNGSFSPHKDNTILSQYSTVHFDFLDDKILLGTASEGCYLLDSGEIKPLMETLNRELESSELNKLKVLSNGEIAIGTIKNGVFLFNPKEKSFSRLNRAGGLQNNTVLAIEEFKDQLWLGLDNGLDRVQLNAPISYYTDYSGKLGNTYDILKVADGVFLGSNSGVYFLNDSQLQFLEGSQGHVWDLSNVSGNILGGHNKGTFEINNMKFSMISGFTGGYQLISSSKDNVYLQGNYSGIAKLSKIGKDWSYLQVNGLNVPVKYLCFESGNVLWVSHPHRGFYRLVMSDDYEEILEIKNYDHDVESNYNVKVYKIQNQVIIHAGGVWYRYNEILDKVEQMSEFDKYRNMELLDYGGENTFWWISDQVEDSKSIIYTDLKKIEYSFNEKELTDRLVPEAQKVVRFNDSIYGFTLTDGFAFVNTNKIANYNSNAIQIPTLQSFKDEKLNYELSLLKSVPFKSSSSIFIEVSTPEMVTPNYGYRLNGKESFLDNSKKGVLHLQNLDYGSYELEIWTIGSDNDTSEPLHIKFSIAPPWYLSGLSIAFYVLAILGLIFWIRHSTQQKFRRKQILLKKELYREQQEMVLQNEKDNLAKEIRDKQKKLTKTTLSIAKKNEVILELKRILLLNKENFNDPQRYKSIMSKLNKTVDNKDEWKQFEVNFTELHEDFFEKLLAEFPELTPKDLKLSAYLKMNLSSKEIAPLMGISTRGVEIHRYRLRKKLQIDSSKNLSNFLIRFK